MSFTLIEYREQAAILREIESFGARSTPQQQEGVLGQFDR